MRKPIESDKQMFIGDICYHGDRKVSVAAVDSENVTVHYFDNPPTFEIQSDDSSSPFGLQPVMAIGEIVKLKKTELSYPTENENRIEFLMGVLSIPQALNGFDNDAREEIVKELNELGVECKLVYKVREPNKEQEPLKIIGAVPESNELTKLKVRINKF